jgi:hypothetical protein
MVKFGKEFRKLQNEEFKQHYIDYKLLKVFIRTSMENFLNNNNNKEKEKDLTVNIPKLDSPNNSMDSSQIMPSKLLELKSPQYEELDQENIKEDRNNNQTTIPAVQLQLANSLPLNNLNSPDDILKHFIKLMDKEIKKIYLFFVNRERELYVQINSHLHIRQTYDTFNLKNIAKEYEELTKISQTSFNISKFINDNMTAIKKILKKFDKKFEQLFGRIALRYIQRKLESRNSDLLYILQFKIIDEVSAILEDMLSDLKFKYDDKKLKIGSNNPLEENLINSTISSGSGSSGNSGDFPLYDKDLTILIDRYHNELRVNIYMIDEYNQTFRNNFKEWSNHLKQNSKVYNNAFSVTMDTSLCGQSINLNTNTNSAYDRINMNRNVILPVRKESLDNNLLFSKENGNNIYLTLFHTFFFMFCYSIVLPTNVHFVFALGYKAPFSGVIMAMTPLGALVSLFYTGKWIQVSFKKPMVVSVLLLSIGNLFYILSAPCNCIYLMALGRFILGLSSNRVANRSYLLQFIPKRKLSQFLLYFQTCSLVGLALGPLISIPILYLGEIGGIQNYNSVFNYYTNTSWFVLFFSIIFTVFTFISYTEPLQSNFTIYSPNMPPSDATSQTQTHNSAVNRETLSRKEGHMIDEINDKLNEVNDRNKFSDTNLVANTIEQIAWKEKKTTSYLYRCFIIFIILLIVVRITTESLLIISPYYIQDLDSEFDSKLVALLMGASLLLVIPVGLLYTHYLGSKIRDRKSLIYLIIACIFFNFFILNLFYTSLVQYCIMFVFLIVSATLLENMATTMFSKIIPSDYEVFKLNAGLVIQIATTLGRFIGAAMLTCAGFASDENLNRITYGITLGLFIAVLVMSIVFYSDLRVKAIARILRLRTMRKLKKTEF